MTAHDKDRILAELKVYKPHNEIEGLYEVLPELESEEYVEVWRNEQHNPISVRLTSKGNTFVENGGYKARRKYRIKANVKKAAKWFLVTLVGAALIELATQAVQHWLSK